MCSEPLVMNLAISILRFTSMNVKLMSFYEHERKAYVFFNKSFDPRHTVFWFWSFSMSSVGFYSLIILFVVLKCITYENEIPN